jgi:hypothetical protein
MNLQRISEFAEIQEGNAFLLINYLKTPSSLHPEVFT